MMRRMSSTSAMFSNEIIFTRTAGAEAGAGTDGLVGDGGVGREGGAREEALGLGL